MTGSIRLFDIAILAVGAFNVVLMTLLVFSF